MLQARLIRGFGMYLDHVSSRSLLSLTMRVSSSRGAGPSLSTESKTRIPPISPSGPALPHSSAILRMAVSISFTRLCFPLEWRSTVSVVTCGCILRNDLIAELTAAELSPLMELPGAVIAPICRGASIGLASEAPAGTIIDQLRNIWPSPESHGTAIILRLLVSPGPDSGMFHPSTEPMNSKALSAPNKVDSTPASHASRNGCRGLRSMPLQPPDCWLFRMQGVVRVAP